MFEGEEVVFDLIGIFFFGVFFVGSKFLYCVFIVVEV